MVDVGPAVDRAAKAFQRKVTIGSDVIPAGGKVNVKSLNSAVASLIKQVSDDLERRISETLKHVLDPIKKDLDNNLNTVRQELEGAQSATKELSNFVKCELEESKQYAQKMSASIVKIEDNLHELRTKADEIKTLQDLFRQQFSDDLTQLEARVDEKMEVKRKQAEHTAQVATEDAKEKTMAELDGVRSHFSSEIATQSAEKDKELKRLSDELANSMADIKAATSESDTAAQARLEQSSQDLRKQLDECERRLEENAALAKGTQRHVDSIARDIQTVESYWCHFFEWHPDPKPSATDQNVLTDSVQFDAAGYRDLRLDLSIEKSAERSPSRKDKSPKGTCFVHLSGASSCRIRIMANSESLLCSQDPFGGKIGGPVDIAGLTISVEFLEGNPPLTAIEAPVNCVSNTHTLAVAPYVDAEVATMRNRMVRQVDWLLVDVMSVSDECISSPLFSAGGVDNLQLHFYPDGYRATQAGQCGFFLQAPTGVYIKCRAFVGQVDKVFEHRFETSAPFGRGSFCRAAKVMSPGSDVRCGIEILEVYQDWTKITRSKSTNILKIRNAAAGIEDSLEIRGAGKPLPNKLDSLALKNARSVPSLSASPQRSPKEMGSPSPLSRTRDKDRSPKRGSQEELPRIR